MNSGLYALAGASATATAAACAKRFEEPMTNASKWYLGLTRDSAGITALSVCWGRGPIGSSSKTGSADSGWLLGGAAAGAAEEIAELVFACGRSEEHTSELQSRGHLVCRLLLVKRETLGRLVFSAA